MGGAQCLAHVAVDRREGATDACTAYVHKACSTCVVSVCGECAVGMSAVHSGRCGIGSCGRGYWVRLSDSAFSTITIGAKAMVPIFDSFTSRLFNNNLPVFFIFELLNTKHYDN